MVRAATAADAGAVAGIYNHYIANSEATFEVDPVTAEEMADRISTISADYPFVVDVRDGEVHGYSYINRWKNRCAYNSTVECTVYVDPEFIRRGVGRILFTELLRLAGDGGWHAIIAGISLPNPASIALHESFGFVQVAHFKQTGFKFDRWIDVGYWELLLGEAEEK